MIYEIELSEDALADIEKHIKSGDNKLLQKIDALLNELREHPTTGRKAGEIETLQNSNLGHEE